MRRDILQETFRLLTRHFDLFTMIALTVWLPGHLVINYLDFFATSKGAADAAARSFRVAILLEGVFAPSASEVEFDHRADIPSHQLGDAEVSEVAVPPALLVEGSGEGVTPLS